MDIHQYTKRFVDTQWPTILRQSWVLTKANLKSRYRNSIAGYLWVIISPLSLYVVQAYVFKIVFKIQTENYLVFLLFGLIPWIFFSQTLEMVTSSFYGNGKLLKSVAVHPLSLILAQVSDNLINNMTVLFLILVGLQLFTDFKITDFIFFPLPYIILGITATALGFFLASLNVFFIDVKFVLSFMLSILFYLTPIVYPENFVPREVQYLIKYNPLTYIIRPFRSLHEHDMLFLKHMLLAAIICFCVICLSFFYWRLKRNELYLRL